MQAFCPKIKPHTKRTIPRINVTICTIWQRRHHLTRRQAWVWASLPGCISLGWNVGGHERESLLSDRLNWEKQLLMKCFFMTTLLAKKNDLLGPNKCTGQSKANLPRCHQRPHDVLSSFPRHLIPFKSMRTCEPVRRAVSPKHTLTSEEPKMSIGKNGVFKSPVSHSLFFQS